MTALAALQRCLAAFELHEPSVHAWACTDETLARRAAVAADGRGDLPLAGLVLGVKDVFTTADLPTAFGSPIYAGNQPRDDAAVVSLLRRAGAVVLGKTVTVEFATRHPGPTTNPHRSTHTPGGSSMGSAAAVATGMADVALGTQTLGSVIRPASFCGVYGYKPTYGHVSVSGLKLVAPSLDTVGWFARDVAALDSVRTALTGRAPRARAEGPPRIALIHTEQWSRVGPDSAGALEEALSRAAAHGAVVGERDDPAGFGGLVEGATTVMAYEAARSLSFEYETYASMLSPELLALIEEGYATDPAARDEVLATAREVGGDLATIFAEADVLATPAALGEAPEGLTSTGDPRCAAPWTLLGFPAVSVPGLTGSSGLPVGVQLVARPGHDAALLAAAEWLGALLATASRG